MTEKEQRKSFQNLDLKDNPHFLEDAKQIYGWLKKKYPEPSAVDLDNILNALCVSLVILVLNHVEKDNRKSFLQLIYTILNKNL